MRISQLLLATLKENPADAEIISHKLMLRAGMIRKLASGLYIWLPLGLRVLRKVENIVREEMDRVGALELLMPAVQPAELWQESGRWELYGAELLRFSDRHERDFCFGPTHEEVITDLFRREVHSYKQLPINFYQIQTKFRDEIRPRFGVMRAREFIMKDAYSFHIDMDCLENTYQKMYGCYSNIFDRIGIEYRAVHAATGSIGGEKSHEFQVLADSGEDKIFYSDKSDYAANVELAEAITEMDKPPAPAAEMQLVETPGQKTIEDVAKFLKCAKTQTVKTLIVEAEDNGLIALVLRGDHELNEAKAATHPKIASPLQFATEEKITKALGVGLGSIGPVDLKIPVIVDRSAAVVGDFCCGANQDDKHYINVNWKRDCKLPEVFDLRNVVEGDPSPDGKGTLKGCRGIEVGHIFQLGDKYSKAMHVTVLDEQGSAITPKMGCYGIGVSRIVAASIEQNHDENGIIWPDAIAPFDIILIPMNMHKSQRVREAADKLYQELITAGFEVLLDDRNERAGVMFNDADLIGIPHRIVVGERGLDAGELEYKHRREAETQKLKLESIIDFLNKKVR